MELESTGLEISFAVVALAAAGGEAGAGSGFSSLAPVFGAAHLGAGPELEGLI